VDVVGLDREVNDSKPVAPTLPEGGSQKRADDLRPQVRQARSNPEGEVNRLVATVVGPARVRGGALRARPSASALTPTSPRSEL